MGHMLCQAASQMAIKVMVLDLRSTVAFPNSGVGAELGNF